MSPSGSSRTLYALRYVFAALLFVALVAPGAAQEVAFTTVTRGEFGGSMGQMMQMIPGANEPTRETTFVKGSLMRTDSEGSSTIIDAATGVYTMLQHDERTFYSFSMEEMAAMGAAMAEGMMGQGMQGEGGQPSMETSLSTERTGRTQEIGGVTAEEVLMIIEMIPTGEPQEAQGMGMGMMGMGMGGGATVLLSQLWMSSEVPGYEAYQAAQAQMGEAFMKGGGGQGMAAAFASDPRMKEAFEANKEAMAEMEGLAVKTVSAFIMVPEGQEFDRDAALASLDEPLAAGGGMGDAAAQSAADAARNAMRGLGGMFGNRGGDEEAEEEPQTQTVLMRAVSTIEDIRTSGITDDLFKVPEGYRKIDPGIGG